MTTLAERVMDSMITDLKKNAKKNLTSTEAAMALAHGFPGAEETFHKKLEDAGLIEILAKNDAVREELQSESAPPVTIRQKGGGLLG